MGAPKYTDAEDALMRQMVADRAGLRDIATALGRSTAAISAAIRKRGLCIDPDAAAERRVTMNRARKGERRPGSMACTPERREKLRAYARKMNSDPAIRAAAIEKMRASRRSAEGREKARRARELQLAPKFGGWPQQFREQYRFLTRSKGIPAEEARAMILPQIERFLTGHEGRMWKVASGRARLVENVKITRPVSYTPSSSAGAMT